MTDSGDWYQLQVLTVAPPREWRTFEEMTTLEAAKRYVKAQRKRSPKSKYRIIECIVIYEDEEWHSYQT